mmetsp:Transcript_9678/g.20887  ORF Transcript_9678/g.20887 Transcript_9678/m.20887 type:complete len:500 (+) Transcript_9678:193-1692(+)
MIKLAMLLDPHSLLTRRPSPSHLFNLVLFVYFYTMIRTHQTIPDTSSQSSSGTASSSSSSSSLPLHQQVAHLRRAVDQQKAAAERKETELQSTVQKLEQEMTHLRQQRARSKTSTVTQQQQQQRQTPSMKQRPRQPPLKQQQQPKRPFGDGPRAQARKRQQQRQALEMVREEDDPNTYQYNLTAMVMFRVNFAQDRLNFTRTELDQWLTYMEYAGVQHFFLYDNCQDDEEETECVEPYYAHDPRVTYIRWNPRKKHHHHNNDEEQYRQVQVRALEHHWQRHHHNPKLGQPETAVSYHKNAADKGYHATSRFEVQLDIDEYPFVASSTLSSSSSSPQEEGAAADHEPGFLWRYIERHMWSQRTDQVLVRSWFYGGEPSTTTTTSSSNLHSWRAGRYLHKDPQAWSEGGRTKAIYRPAHVTAIGVHLSQGARHTVTADPDRELHLKHYWCERLSEARNNNNNNNKNGDDTQSSLIRDEAMVQLLNKIIQWNTTKHAAAVAG